jgi:pilus assembly protein FimV
MNRSLKLSMLVALALGTSHAFAMELGQVQVKSDLGQPLLAEIPLNAANQAEMKNLSVRLASSEDFARAGIVGGRTSIPLRFSVANTGSGRSVIRITSSVPVDDPYLDLLIEVNGGGGKSVREFAILLDPPHSSVAAPAMSSSPGQRVSSRTTPVPARSSVTASAPAPLPPRSAAQPQGAVVNGKYGPVERGQTLSGVARSTAPAGVDFKQMMVALQQANPDAFYRENINALKSGAVLRVPTAAEARAMTVAAAMAEVRRQNSDWRAGTPGKPSVVADAATRAPTSGNAGKASDNSDRLALVPAKDGGNGAGARAGDASGKSDKSASAVRQDLMRAKESVVSLQQQGADLKSRIKDLSDINSKNDRLLSLKDNEIAELQSKLAAARKTAGLPAAASAAVAPAPAASTATIPSVAAALPGGDLKTATVGTSANPEETPVSSSSAALASNGMPSAAMAPATSTPVPAVAAPAAAEPVAQPIVSKAQAPAIVVQQPWYKQTWAWAVGGVAVVVLILLAMLGRRRKGPAGSAASKTSLADRFGSAAARDSHPLSEEDIDQEELLDQLAEHPDDIGLHLELVTLYYSRRNVEYFEAAAEAMYAHVTDPEQDEWQDVLHMGEDLAPEHPLFDHHPALPVNDEDEARREFDIDDYADDHDAPAVESVPTPPLPSGVRKVSEYNFNFDLTRPHGDETQVDPAAHSDDVTVMAPLMNDAPETHGTVDPESSWQFDEVATPPAGDQDVELGDFSDDPIDTKLDLARAYLDMGDADGARAMLGEVVKEGTQTQRETAKRLLDNIS